MFLVSVGLVVSGEPVGKETDFVDLEKHIQGIKVETPYATENNFLKQAVYPANRLYLRRSVADRLALVQADLKTKGLGLKVLDGFRPLSVQRSMWKILPDSKYVANPARGSRHNRGAAVDVTLVDAEGKELEMPTKFDDFSKAAHVDAPTANAQAAKNRATLQNAMKARGFQSISTEWWHFDAPDWQSFPIADATFDELAKGAAKQELGLAPAVQKPPLGPNAPIKKSLDQLEQQRR